MISLSCLWFIAFRAELSAQPSLMFGLNSSLYTLVEPAILRSTIPAKILDNMIAKSGLSEMKSGFYTRAQAYSARARERKN